MRRHSGPTTPLHELADRLGIARSYVAASGQTVVVADATLRALCEVSGFAADSDQRIAQALAELAGDDSGLDPVLVVDAGCAIEVHWRGAVQGGEALAWRIVLEHGETLDGSGRLDAAASRPEGAVARLGGSDLPIGYHRLELTIGDATSSAALIIVPPCAWTPPQWQQADGREWSITAQLYSLRSPRNWGIGDFTDLGDLARHAARLGAASIGLNPLHALFPSNPRHLSPYSPSSRTFLNPVYIDVEAVPELAQAEAAQALIADAGFQARLDAARRSEQVDHEAVWQLKLDVLRLLHAAFRAGRDARPDGDRAQAFESFRAAGGASLTNFARFEALQRHLIERGDSPSWHAWPASYRDAGSAAVAGFAADHAADVEFSEYLQWEADRQLGQQAAAMRAAGMTTGLYRDLAVGVDPNGGEAWGDQSLLVAGATVGAPPDIYNPKGQDWGLTPFGPKALQRSAYAGFIATIRSNMRHAGALRIDHVIGLKRLYWVPSGMGAAAGSYVGYPFDDLMGIIALESQRNRCVVVGEDLGTVPEGFREQAERRGMLSYRVLMFERENGDGAFLRPSQYPPLAAATASTHDLPTLAGLWSGRDLDWRAELGLYPAAEDARNEREFRAATLAALARALALPGPLRSAGDPAPPPAAAITALIEAAYVYLARSPSRLLLVQIEDLAGEVEQMNMPGTVDEHPNWRRKLQRTIDELFADAAIRRLAERITRARAAD